MRTIQASALIAISTPAQNPLGATSSTRSTSTLPRVSGPLTHPDLYSKRGR